MGNDENTSSGCGKCIEVHRPLMAAGNETETGNLKFEKGTEWVNVIVVCDVIIIIIIIIMKIISFILTEIRKNKPRGLVTHTDQSDERFS